MLGKVFAVLVISSFLFAGFSGNMAEVCTAAIDGANEAVTLSISLLGVMCLWSGVIRTLDKARAYPYSFKSRLRSSQAYLPEGIQKH